MQEYFVRFLRTRAQYELHPVWWLYLPLSFYALRYAAHLFGRGGRDSFNASFLGELGIVENLTVLLLVLALLVTIAVLIRFGKSLHLRVKIFLLLYCLGCIYFAGEEASWGQHWFGWESSEYFMQANDQQETNFHNTSIWLDRVPKSIVSLLVFLGGIVAPLWFAYRGIEINAQKPGWWLWPTWICLPSAVIATIATWPSKIENAAGMKFYFDQAQETKEAFFACFILLFILSLSIRLSRMTKQGTPFSPL